MAFFGPVRQSIIPDMVPREYLLNAISLSILTRQSAVVIGPAIAGLLIALYGVGSVYALNAVALLIMIITLVPLKIPAHARTDNSSFGITSLALLSFRYYDHVVS